MSLFFILVDFVITLMLLALWIRMFLMQPTSFTQPNPIADIAMRVSGPLMGPVEKAIGRGSRRVDFRPLLPIALLLVLQIILAGVFAEHNALSATIILLHRYARMLTTLYLVLILAFSVLYRYSPYPHNSILRLAFRMVEPLFEALGRVSSLMRNHIGVFSTLFVLALYGTLTLALFSLQPGIMMAPPGFLVTLVVGKCLLFLPQLATFFMYVVIAGAVLSWVSPDPGNAIVQVIHFLSDPLNRPARRLLPTMGGIDFSPIVTILALSLISGYTHALAKGVMSGLAPMGT